MKVTGAELFVKALKAEKVDTLFAYPGGQAIDLFNALYGEKDIDVILPRHEQGLIHAADGYARSTGKTGVCLVTSGPGATNLVTGIATANYDSVPLVCFTGQVPTNLIGNDAFQEVDIVGITRNISKYAVTVRNREDLAETIKKAFYIAKTGKPGVVVVDLPKDIQRAYGSDLYPEEINIRGYKPNTSVHTRQINKAIEVLNNAEKPVFLIGGGVNIAGAHREMTKLAEITGVPVITTIMGKGTIPTNHKLYIGNIGIHGCYAANYAVNNCDVLFSIGTRFNDRITGKIQEFAQNATIIHIDIDTASISRNIKVDVPIVADAKNAINYLIKNVKTLEISEWQTKINRLKEQNPISMRNNGLTPQKILQNINTIFSNAIIATDIGQNQMWTTQFLELNENKQLLTSGGLGTMGYGLPAAIGAKLGNPNKDVIVVCGDGGIQMNIQEMATAVVYELPIIICILNNGYLGNVRQWQEMFYNKRYSGTCMRYRKSCAIDCNNPNKCCPDYIPDFVKLAESYSAKGIRVTDTEQVESALSEAKNNIKTPTIIEFIIDREKNVIPIVPPGNSLSDMILESEGEYNIFIEESKKCNPPLDDEELNLIWGSACKFAKKVQAQEGYIPPDEYEFRNESLKPSDYSDIGQAKVLAREYGDELRFTSATDFIRYDGSSWVESKQKAVGAVEEFLDLQLEDAEDEVKNALQAVAAADLSEADVVAGGKKFASSLNEEQSKLYPLTPSIRSRWILVPYGQAMTVKGSSDSAEIEADDKVETENVKSADLSNQEKSLEEAVS